MSLSKELVSLMVVLERGLGYNNAREVQKLWQWNLQSSIALTVDYLGLLELLVLW